MGLDNFASRTPDRVTLTPQVEMAALQRFFAICAERGIGLIGWS